MAVQLTGELSTLTTSVAFADEPSRRFIRVTGSDATRWLNGMVTNSIQAAEPGTGTYNFVLSAQGRIQADCVIYRDQTAGHAEYLIATTADQVENLTQLLDRFIIMDDVELHPAPGEVAEIKPEEQSLLLVGPKIADVLTTLNLPFLEPLRLAHAESSYGPVLLTTLPYAGVPRMELRAQVRVIGAVRDALQQAGVSEASALGLEQLRIVEARPRYSQDIRDRDLPQETAQTHALHFAKGCYVGQEIVERIRSRGQVHRQLTPFLLEGTLPQDLPAALESNGKAAGEITSAVAVSTTEGECLLALGYTRRELLETRAPLQYPGGIARPRAAGALS